MHKSSPPSLLFHKHFQGCFSALVRCYIVTVFRTSFVSSYTNHFLLGRICLLPLKTVINIQGFLTDPNSNEVDLMMWVVGQSVLGLVRVRWLVKCSKGYSKLGSHGLSKLNRNLRLRRAAENTL